MAKEQVWAMEPNYLHDYLEKLELAALQPIPKAWFDDDDEEESRLAKLYTLDQKTGIATIDVTGPLSMTGPSFWARYFGMSGTGYKSILQALTEANANASVKGIMLAVNSPGGEVNGCDLVWQNIRGSSKPVVAANCGMMASAAYYLSSAAESIYASSPGDETGSIGVVISGIDDSGYLEKNGVRRINIYSKNAPNKAMSFSTEKGRELLQSRVDAFERLFHSRVAEGRGIPASEVTEKFGAGGIFMAGDPDKTQKDALKMGLIDGIGGATEALLRMISAPVVNLQFRAEADKPFSAKHALAELKSPFGSAFDSLDLSAVGVMERPTEKTLMYQTVDNPEALAPVKKETTPKTALPQEGKRMTLDEFMAQGPQAVAEVEALQKTVRTDIMAVNAEVSAILEKEAYGKSAALRAAGLKVMKGESSLESFKTLVSFIDMQAEQASLTLEQGSGLKETPAAGPVASAAALLADAKELGINVKQIQEAAKVQGIDPDKALIASIENAKMAAADRGVMVGA
ncbi:MAG TPA: S49 family peptidase [Candidatus Udaeobacter sp.]|nr:S49 family peptidase [Candidatus Udaeobacter sp.]